MITTASPCVRNCCLNEQNICLGCFRSIAEIMQWVDCNEQQKQAILREAMLRSERARKALIDKIED